MKRSKVLQESLKLFGGLTFESAVEISEDQYNALLPFIAAIHKHLTAEEAHEMIMYRVMALISTCIRNKDAYHRFRGDDAFYYLILAEWNVASFPGPLSPASLKTLVSLFVNARRCYLADQDPKRTRTPLNGVIDEFIEMIDYVDSTIETRRVLGLKGPTDANSNIPWPPAHFSKLDVAIMGERTTRRALFGVSYKHKAVKGCAPLYPHDQDFPLNVRKYLCWLALTEKSPDSKVALFLSPIAFISHEKRQEWYLVTGHKSRFYSTADEFLSYAEDEFKMTGKMAKQHVIGLLTPWFFKVEAVVEKGIAKDKAIPTVWQQTCFRAGMVLIISRFKHTGRQWTYQFALFKPDLPYYQRAAEPPERQQQRDAWLKEFLKKVKRSFSIERGWIGGECPHHVEPPASRGVPADSVELSSEFITEIMENQKTFPVTDREYRSWSFFVIEDDSDSDTEE